MYCHKFVSRALFIFYAHNPVSAITKCHTTRDCFYIITVYQIMFDTFDMYV